MQGVSNWMETTSKQSWAKQPLISHWATYAQWIAIITMTIDHAVKYLISSDDYLWLSDSVGRLAFPLFAGMLVWHWAFNTRDREAYANRVLIIGFTAQIPYMLVFNNLALNVCFTLGLAMYGLNWVAHIKSNERQLLTKKLHYALVFAAALLINSLIEYGAMGLFYIMALGLYFDSWRGLGTTELPQPAQHAANWALISLLTSAMINHSTATNMVSFGATFALLSLPLFSYLIPPTLALPRWLRLGWYPGHIVLIGLFLVT